MKKFDCTAVFTSEEKIKFSRTGKKNFLKRENCGNYFSVLNNPLLPICSRLEAELKLNAMPPHPPHETFEALLLYNKSMLLCIQPNAACLANEQTNTLWIKFRKTTTSGDFGGGVGWGESSHVTQTLGILSQHDNKVKRPGRAHRTTTGPAWILKRTRS